MKDSGLRNKVVIVTGGTSGIGRATAIRFAQEGARVAIWDMSDAASEAVLGELKSAGAADSLYRKVNVTEAASVQAGVDEVMSRWGSIYALVNNAGILRDGLLVKVKDGAVVSSLSDEQFDAVINVNLKGVFVCTRAAAPHMIAGGGGVVLNASSVVGLYGNFGQTNYIATKAAVIGMTKTWARELGRYKIRVNAVAPGYIGTEMVKQMPEKILDVDGFAHAAGTAGQAGRNRRSLLLAGVGRSVVYHRNSTVRRWRCGGWNLDPVDFREGAAGQLARLFCWSATASAWETAHLRQTMTG